MVLPSKTRQIEEITGLLDAALDAAEKGEEMSTETLAKTIVNSYHRLLQAGIKKPVLHPHVGLAFKVPMNTSTWFVAYDAGDRVWLISASSRYGFFAAKDDVVWQYAEESEDGRRPKKVKDEEGNETGEVIPLGPRPGAPGHNPEWVVGDRVSQHQREHFFRVVATGDKCVLLQKDGAGYQVESNESLGQFYRRETEEKIVW